MEKAAAVAGPDKPTTVNLRPYYPSHVQAAAETVLFWREKPHLMAQRLYEAGYITHTCVPTPPTRVRTR